MSNIRLFTSMLMLVISCVMHTEVSAQKRKRQQDAIKMAGPDSLVSRRGDFPKHYTEVIPNTASTTEGLFNVHKVGDKYFLEIADSLLEKELLIVNRISKAPAIQPFSIPGRIPELSYPGDLINRLVVKFSQGPGNKIFLKSIAHLERSNDSTPNGLSSLVAKTNIPPIVQAFPIKSRGLHDASVVLDITELAGNDNDVLFFDASVRKTLSLGALQVDRSYIDTIKSFPRNVEIKTVKTYARDSRSVTFELNSSIVLLPEIPMKSRKFDPRVGYFYGYFMDYDQTPQNVSQSYFIRKWRLEPKQEDVARYLRGELVEPQQPIIFYIDPETPKKWVPYLMAGVNDWQQAFEQAGFKNAIMAREAPSDDPTWSIEDARHNVIVYKASPVQNASGPHIHDPRTGEILESHINWYHNVLRLLHNWYFIQAGPIDPRARKMEFDDELMGRLVRFVISHEVGHTIGLTHNFGASSTVPVDSLRSKRWVEENGHTPSIMDYARFNYVAQPEDSIGEKGIMPRIGVYDRWAIEWGYRWYPEFGSPKEENAYLNKWVINHLEKDNRLYFGYEGDLINPRAQSEDLGDDAIKASGYGIRNLQRILTNIMEWTQVPDEEYSDLKEMFGEVVAQYKRYLFHVSDCIGGQINVFKRVGQPGPIKHFIGRSRQKEAVRFLHGQLFNTPKWMIQADIKLMPYISSYGFYGITMIQKEVLEQLLSHGMFMNLLWAQTTNPNDHYSINELLTDLSSGIWRELRENKPVSDMSRRSLQKIYLDRILVMIDYKSESHTKNVYSGTSAPVSVFTDVSAILRAHLIVIRATILKAAIVSKDQTTREHLNELVARIDRSKYLSAAME